MRGPLALRSAALGSPGPCSWSALFDPIRLVLEGGERFGMLALDRLEVLALLPPDVIVQQRSDAAQRGGISGDDLAGFNASQGEVAQHAVLLDQPIAEGRILRERQQDPLLIIEVFPHFAVPHLDEGRDRSATGVQVGVGRALQIARLDEAAHVLAGERLKRLVALQRLWRRSGTRFFGHMNAGW